LNISKILPMTQSRELSFGPVSIYLDEVLGLGFYGKVCKAKCGQLPCVAKGVHKPLMKYYGNPGDQNLIKKFLQECQFLSTMKHPNILQYLGVSTPPHSHSPAILMELADESLTRFLERLTGPLPYHSQLNICHDVALALAYLHSNGITHRDLSSLMFGESTIAKVGDFGVAKLIDVNNPRETPLTQYPGTPAYMPPEAFVELPVYSSKLDCYSSGVLTIQIVTRNFPNPGKATSYVQDPTQRVIVHPETERRKNDIDRIEPSHPLLPIALDCLKQRDTERPSADELCERLAPLKREARYTESVDQTRGHVQTLQKEIDMKDAELERARLELEGANEAKEWLQASVEELSRALQEKIDNVERAREHIQRLQEDIDVKRAELERVNEQHSFFLKEKKELDQSLQAKLHTILQSIDQAKKHIQRLEEEIDAKNAQLERQREELIKASERKEKFDVIIEQYFYHLQGQTESIKELISQGPNRKSIAQGSHDHSHHTPQQGPHPLAICGPTEKPIEKPTLQPTLQFCKDPLSSRPSHNELYRALCPVLNDWEQLGLLLNCDYAKLQSIKNTECKDEARLIQLTHLLTEQSDMSWKLVIEAVEDAGHPYRAKVISERVTTSAPT
jgi:serine/threonine protein kinase